MSSQAVDIVPGNCFGTFKLPDPVAFVAAHAEGADLWTTDGRKLVDCVLGSGPMMIGHAHPQVVAAIQEQAVRGTTFYAMNDVAPRLAARIAELVPCAKAMKFVSDGAEATFYALRLARAFTGRDLILKFEGAYHGHHDYSLHGLKPARGVNYPVAQPDSAGIPHAVSETILIAPYNDIEATRQLVASVGDRLAAIIVEPIQRSLMPRAGFLAGLRELCDQTDASTGLRRGRYRVSDRAWRRAGSIWRRAGSVRAWQGYRRRFAARCRRGASRHIGADNSRSRR